ncbi:MULTISPECIES: helix-turn-helix domain-containing protein [unclassified Mesorhizobium]|uniref:helix-turn-helix domain-containing protein n=1 Tax=unclassified Mesorhizobium TaxID=325217 RepID=UPI0015E410E6|nr:MULTISPECIES: helix-turn-helix transcriptional regulator [unclassified Mesorhizobium]MBZ9702147.1 helix-turn-helix domain-containing protein [Mesorhizobium sp. CO1-1-3]MBZ9947233.1 helix-turn-helix domain-containing protein [Mesorhizobium sp. BR1-1-11]
MEKNDLSALGDIIKSHRMTHKMGRVEFSNRAGITQRTLANIENGLTRPQKETVVRLAVAMGRSYLDLMDSATTGGKNSRLVIKDDDDLVHLLSGKPQSWGQVISVRTALRVLPNVSDIGLSKVGKSSGVEKFLIALFRSMHIARFTSRYGNQNTKLAARARESLDSLASIKGLPRVAFEAGGAIFWATTARGQKMAPNTVDWAVRSLGEKGKRRADDLWSAINSDCNKLIEADLVPRNLASIKLWPEGQPIWFMDIWKSFQSMLHSLGAHWSIWVHLYESWLNGNRSLGLSADLAEVFDTFIYNQSDAWWDRPSVEISIDLELFVRNLLERRGPSVGPSEDVYSDATVLTQRPAPHQFGERAGLIFAYPTVSRLGGSAISQDIWRETVEKAKRTAERMRRTQAPAHVVESVERLVSSLGKKIEDVSPGILLMRSRTIEADLATFDTEQAKDELMTDAQSLLRDLAASLEDLRALFPEIIEIEAARIAQKVADGSALPAYDNAKQVMNEARASDVVDGSAIDALEAALIDIAEVELVIGESSNDIVTAMAVKKRADLISLHLLDVRNFSASVLKAFKHLGGDSKRILSRGAADVSKRAYKGALDGVEEGTKAGVKIALAALVTSLAGPLAGLAVYVGSFVSLSRKANEVAEKIESEEQGLDV